MANLPALIEELESYFTQRPSQHWLDVLEKVGVPAGPILNVKEMHEDPQTIAREMVTEVDHPKAGRTKVIGLPVKFSDTPGRVQHAAPLFGQHTREVLAEYGFNDDEIQKMIDESAVRAADASTAKAAE
jgi:crotonobetainyl-CoA:carnitine CoA-transferase CaiB-like acyl-CoA transferase